MLTVKENKRENRKVAFLDRDGVINKRAAQHEYIMHPADFHFNEGIFELLTDLAARGFEFIIVTNQRGISRELFSEKDLAEIHAFMREGLAKRGIEILDIFYCPHAENSCDCRKPKPGLLEQACKRYAIDLTASILITDSSLEVEMGKKFGIGKNYLIESDKPKL